MSETHDIVPEELEQQPGHEREQPSSPTSTGEELQEHHQHGMFDTMKETAIQLGEKVAHSFETKDKVTTKEIVSKALEEAKGSVPLPEESEDDEDKPDANPCVESGAADEGGEKEKVHVSFHGVMDVVVESAKHAGEALLHPFEGQQKTPSQEEGAGGGSQPTTSEEEPAAERPSVIEQVLERTKHVGETLLHPFESEKEKGEDPTTTTESEGGVPDAGEEVEAEKTSPPKTGEQQPERHSVVDQVLEGAKHVGETLLHPFESEKQKGEGATTTTGSEGEVPGTGEEAEIEKKKTSPSTTASEQPEGHSVIEQVLEGAKHVGETLLHPFESEKQKGEDATTTESEGEGTGGTGEEAEVEKTPPSSASKPPEGHSVIGQVLEGAKHVGETLLHPFESAKKEGEDVRITEIQGKVQSMKIHPPTTAGEVGVVKKGEEETAGCDDDGEARTEEKEGEKGVLEEGDEVKTSGVVGMVEEEGGGTPSTAEDSRNVIHAVKETILHPVDAAKTIGDKVLHPVDTAKTIGGKLLHPVDTAKSIGDKILHPFGRGHPTSAGTTSKATTKPSMTAVEEEEAAPDDEGPEHHSGGAGGGAATESEPAATAATEGEEEEGGTAGTIKKEEQTRAPIAEETVLIG